MSPPLTSLAGTFALLAALVGMLLVGVAGDRPSVAPGAQADAEPGAGLDPEELARLGRERTPAVARRVERLRRLRFDSVPVPRMTDTEGLRAYTEEQLARPAMRRRLALAEIELRLLGLLGPGESLTEIAADTSGAAAAYYDPRAGELFLLGDAVPAGEGVTEFVLAHELTHALEDQRFGLRDFAPVASDRGLARAALIEGSATALMNRYAIAHLDPAELARDAEAIDPGTGDLPRFAVAQTLFAYITGARFVESLLELSDDWKLVDHAYRSRPPATSEQVLHPGKYLADEKPLPPPRASAPGPGWRVVHADTMGEFATAEVLREGMATPTARSAAAGWGGDRYVLWRRAGAGPGADPHADHALALAWRWDSARDAREFAGAARRWISEGLGGVPEGEGAWRLPQGWAALRASADAVIVALAPSPEEAARTTHPR